MELPLGLGSFYLAEPDPVLFAIWRLVVLTARGSSSEACPTNCANPGGRKSPSLLCASDIKSIDRQARVAVPSRTSS
ncbi:protein of unknown function [Methylorubrum extorquens DM4]|uniref:Uncharacterized protein n=1 Tax=Methylorubrum extorquens (strain DSM 6343 / CIP 106787 / DM4) TaxID=661410 RepID=C7CGX1_METED|nr:protein of unknown function [Methylorubrum extorquens DM4]